MIPIRDAIRSKNFPAVNFIIIGLNIIVFLWQLAQGPHLKEALYLYGIVPLRYTDPTLSAQFTTLQQYLPFLTSMFLHGGFFIYYHEWFLYIFGDNIKTDSVIFDILFYLFVDGPLA
jgi:membrane associated rhomboid family serine protease